MSARALVQSCRLIQGTVVVRTSTIRPELQYVVESAVNDTAIAARVAVLVAHYSALFDPKDRGLIYVPFKTLGQTLEKDLDIPFYYADIPINQRNQIVDAWMRGSSANRWMVCTSAFIAGNDYAHVRMAICAGNPVELVDFIQFMGRAGRDRAHALAWCIYYTNQPKLTSTRPYTDVEETYKGVHAMNHLLRPQTQLRPCIRGLISRWCDGQTITCAAVADSPKCSACQSLRDTLPPFTRVVHSYDNRVLTLPEDAVSSKRSHDNQDLAMVASFADAVADSDHHRRKRIAGRNKHSIEVSKQLSHLTASCVCCAWT